MAARTGQGSAESSTSQGPVRIFVSYSHHDEEARHRLDTHMAQLKREGVEVFFDGNILPGAELDTEIRRKLWTTDLFVALASPDYLSSRYCYEIEYGYAIRKAGRNGIQVVVAVLKACQWRRTGMARYKLLPNDGKPVDQWARRGDAYEDIVEGIRKVVQAIKRERSTQATVAGVQKPRRGGTSRDGAKPAMRQAPTVPKPLKRSGAPKTVRPSAPAARGKEPAATSGHETAKRPKAKPKGGERAVRRKRPHARPVTPP
jgi:hypothetical protein